MDCVCFSYGKCNVCIDFIGKCVLFIGGCVKIGMYIVLWLFCDGVYIMIMICFLCDVVCCFLVFFDLVDWLYWLWVVGIDLCDFV